MIDRGEQFEDRLIPNASVATQRNSSHGLKEAEFRKPQVAFTVSGRAESRGAVQANFRFQAARHWQEKIVPLVEQELHDLSEIISRSLASRLSEVNDLCAAASSGGGKQLRPTLALLVAKATAADVGFSHKTKRDLLYCAAASELVHLASLVHDDVMDHADTRRHRPTIAKLAGNSSAVLLGDYLFTKAYELAASCRSSYPAKIIAKAAAKLCEGELRQQHSAGRLEMSVGEYRRILALKTGSLSAASCRLGAWSVRADKSVRSDLSCFGMQLGVAFQVFDDWLDYWGDECVGKTLGTDLRQAKPTLPLLYLLSQVGDEEKRVLTNELVKPSRPEEEHMHWILSQLDAHRASEFTREIAERLADGAIASLARVARNEYWKGLEQIANFSVARMS